MERMYNCIRSTLNVQECDETKEETPVEDETTSFIVKLQSNIRCWLIRKLYKSFRVGPSIYAIRGFAHILDALDVTFLQRLEIIDLMGIISAKTEAFHQLKEELNTWDKKISTLVKGKILLEKLASQFQKLKSSNKRHIIKEMAKDRQITVPNETKTEESLKPYQNIFYHLQTNPKYLTRLIYHMTEFQYTTFGERLLHQLYNNASTPREEFYLIQFLKAAIQFEVENKSLVDILGGISMVIKTIFSFYQQPTKYNVFFKAFTAVKSMIMEVKSSVKDEPLILRDLVSKVIASIPVESIPYGIRYMTKVFKQALQEKFPETKDEVIWKPLGLYLYQYMEQVLKAADDDDLLKDKSLYIKNLKAVAELVCQTMSDDFFPPAIGHPASLNIYILRQKPNLRRMIEAVVDVPEPEIEFDFDYYCDITAPQKPVITLSVADIVETHELLSKYEDVVFTNKTDILYQLLKKIEPIPHVFDLLNVDLAAAVKDEALTRTEICLSLNSTNIQLEQKDLEMEILIVITKKLMLDLIRTQPDNELVEILRRPATQKQEEKHATLMNSTAVDTTNDSRSICRMAQSHHLPLKEKKKMIVRNMETLQNAHKCGLTKAITHQGILEKIVINISRRQKIILQQKAELTKLQETVETLDALSSRYQRQMEEYKIFWKNCLENLVIQKSSNTGSTKKEKKEKEGKIQYTASELHKKGVIVGTCKTTKKINRELLTIEIEADHQIKVSLGKRFVHLHVADILNRHYSSNPTELIFHYNVDVSMLLFMVYSKRCSVKTVDYPLILSPPLQPPTADKPPPTVQLINCLPPPTPLTDCPLPRPTDRLPPTPVPPTYSLTPLPH